MNLGLLFLLVAGGGWLLSLIKWRFSFYGLLLYLPFAGMVSLMNGQSAVTLLAKDFVFVIPAYLSFFLFHPRDMQKARVPGSMLATMAIIAVLVVFQSANPNIPNFLVAAIGVKVWLLYMPLLFLASSAVSSKEELQSFLRLNVVLGLIPLTIGLLQWLGIQTIGVANTAEAIYGTNFVVEDYDIFREIDYQGATYRITSTFSAVGQYTCYTMVIIALSATVAISDQERRWRRFSAAVLVIAIVAAILSGSRGAIFFIPVVLVPIMALAGRFVGLLALAVLVPILFVVALGAGGVDPTLLLDEVGGFLVYYAQEYGWNVVIQALLEHPLGLGTGMNTSAARYAFGFDVFYAVESYYVKSIVELGFVAFPLIIFWLWMPIVRGIKLATGGSTAELRRYAAGFTGFFVFVAVFSVRNWPLDIDPINVYFWVLAGVFFKLPLILAEPVKDAWSERSLPAGPDPLVATARMHQ
jgi:hypothetical protein